MRFAAQPRRFLRLAVAAGLLAPLLYASLGTGVGVGCGPNQTEVWFCLNPETGTETNAPYDANHYVMGVFDPCHCYDPCGPQKTCPITVDAGPPPPGCDGGTGDGGTGGGGVGDGGP